MMNYVEDTLHNSMTRSDCIARDNDNHYYAYSGLRGNQVRDDASLVIEDNTIYEIDYECINCRSKNI